MVFIDNSDLHTETPPAQVIYQAAPRSKLVPALLLVLIVAIVALTVVVALPYLKTAADPEQQPETAQISASDLDPEMLMTPTGRKLDVVEFGGFLFEVTRLAYSNSVRARTVTVTVPGKPPQMGVFHVNESFAGGKIRVVDITRETVVLEADGKQQMFTIPGADPSAIWDRSPGGMQMVPPKETGAIPDMPTGLTRAPKNPMADQPADEVEPEGGWESIDDFPDERFITMRRDEYQKFVRELPAMFENDVVLQTAFERETRQPNGLQVKNITVTSMFYAHGIQRDDVIFKLNDQPIRSNSELTTIARSGSFREEVAITVERESGVVTFVFLPGVPD